MGPRPRPNQSPSPVTSNPQCLCLPLSYQYHPPGLNHLPPPRVTLSTPANSQVGLIKGKPDAVASLLAPLPGPTEPSTLLLINICLFFCQLK